MRIKKLYKEKLEDAGLDPDGFDKLTTGEFDEDPPLHEATDGRSEQEELAGLL